MRNLQNRLAFTLAEVLITLAIIGVVAALTIPTLMANYQKTQYVAGLKKAYAEITEAMKLMANDYGCSDDLKCTGLFNNDSNTLGTEFKKYFKLAKDCGTTYDENDEKTKCLSNSYSQYYDATDERSDMNSAYPGSYNFITADGFGISLVNSSCDTNWDTSNTNLNINSVCAEIFIDVNGLKGPNNSGRDIFGFLITNGKGPTLYPFGGSEGKDSGQSWVDASGTPQSCYDGLTSGTYCAGRVMEEGWQMKY